MPVCPKVILVTMFEPQDRAGELTLFRERMELEKVELAATGLDEVYLGQEGDILALIAGVGTANTAISIMALGLCPEVDASESVWLICGIGGADPTTATLGTPVWADWCVDGDFGFEIDAREIPENWETGILPLGAQEPYGQPKYGAEDLVRDYQVFELNGGLVQKALSLCQNVPLVEAEAKAAYLNHFPSDLPTAHAPVVTRGACMSSARYFHGKIATEWARKWTKHWTKNSGTFTICGMEDSGTLHAIDHLSKLGRANRHRALLLRTASNFTEPPPGECASQHFSDENTFPAFDAALENGYRCATAVIDDILANWPEWSAGA